MTFLNYLTVLTLILTSTYNAHAGLLEKTCDRTYKKLDSGPHESLTISIDDFVIGKKTYRGCIIRLSGNANKIKKTQKPDGLFGSYLSPCPNGELPANLPSDFLNEDGWCGDKMSEGPNSTSFTAHKRSIFCAVEGEWDGGGNSDPANTPSPRYSVVVKCAPR